MLYVEVLLIIFFGNFVNCDIIVTDSLFQQLPPIFKIDDYEACKIYCKVSVLLQPQDLTNTSIYWNIIEATIKHPNFYNHNELFHAICVQDYCSNKTCEYTLLDLRPQITEYYNSKYRHLGLNSVVSELNCKNPEHGFSTYSLNTLDITALIISIAYLCFVFYATYVDYQKNNKNHIPRQLTILEKSDVMPIFSLIANWKKLCSLNEKFDIQKLKFIQGIRFYNMVLIIFYHTFSSYIMGYVSNTEYFEEIYKNYIKQGMANQGLFLVQTFFLLSAFLLSHHVYQSMETYKDSKKKYFLLTFLNRYLRILPTVLVMIMFSTTNWFRPLFNGPIGDVYSDKEFQRCLDNWWTNLLFINNHYNENEMCYYITWYLAADTQLYLLSLIILLIIWKYSYKTKNILALCVLTGIILPCLLSVKYGLDMTYRVTPENFKNYNFRSFTFSVIYTSTYTNMASYMVGLFIGYCYFILEKKKISENKKIWLESYNSIWMLIFITLPMAIVYISLHEYSPLVTVMLSGIVKPCYALAIGIGILAMSQQKSGIVKKICEWKPAVFLSNFSYSTYVVQFGIIFYRTGATKEPLYISDYNLVTSFLRDVILSIFCGFLLHIIIEMPALQLQKLYIPRIKDIKPEENSTKQK